VTRSSSTKSHVNLVIVHSKEVEMEIVMHALSKT